MEKTTHSDELKAEKLLKKCIQLLEYEKIPVSDSIAGIKINRRAKSRFGKCTKIKNTYHIEISSILLNLEDKHIENVILHELLHTCYNCMNHGKRWKQYAARLNEKYGYNITVRTSYEMMGLEPPEINKNIKYIIVCEKCGTEYPRQRKCSLVENVDRYKCGKCGGNLHFL
jgi:predicted SprT family Zn-dependent metalloprotease